VHQIWVQLSNDSGGSAIPNVAQCSLCHRRTRSARHMDPMNQGPGGGPAVDSIVGASILVPSAAGHLSIACSRADMLPEPLRPAYLFVTSPMVVMVLAAVFLIVIAVVLSPTQDQEVDIAEMQRRAKEYQEDAVRRAARAHADGDDEYASDEEYDDDEEEESDEDILAGAASDDDEDDDEDEEEQDARLGKLKTN
jgi:hypothetical protein